MINEVFDELTTDSCCALMRPGSLHLLGQGCEIIVGSLGCCRSRRWPAPLSGLPSFDSSRPQPARSQLLDHFAFLLHFLAIWNFKDWVSLPSSQKRSHTHIPYGKIDL